MRDKHILATENSMFPLK